MDILLRALKAQQPEAGDAGASPGPVNTHSAESEELKIVKWNLEHNCDEMRSEAQWAASIDLDASSYAPKGHPERNLTTNWYQKREKDRAAVYWMEKMPQTLAGHQPRQTWNITRGFPTSLLQPPEDAYAFLATFGTLLLIDDSDTDGIDLFFLNHQSRDPGSPATGIAARGYRNVTSAAEVQSIFAAVRLDSGTATGTRCRALLKPYFAHREAQNLHGLLDDVNPLKIIAITDGVPSDDVESVLLAAARKCDVLEAAPHQVGVQFF
ncbi:hypothetical protein ACLOAV_008428 [Pseudogymnoascus australis]